MFVVGQKVRCKTYGEGVVANIDEYYTYSVEVEFTSGVSGCYTQNGEKFGGDGEPSLSVIEE